jgi:pectinesterase
MKYTIKILLLFFSLFATKIHAQTLKVQHDLVVAKDGTGDFRYIQDAINAVRVYLPKPITIKIKKGFYKEKLEVYSTLTNITFVGESLDSTIISYDDFSGKGKMETFDSYTLKVSGNDIKFKNLTIENTAGRVGQAVALHVEGDRCMFDNCKFLGNQDTIFASGENSRQYFSKCYIEGTVDFIFGSSTALFENCHIHSKTDGYITAASTPKWVAYGYVFKDCKLTADKAATKIYLGRPWRDFAKTVFINCEMDSHILPEGWNNWGRPETEKSTFFAEFGSKGVGANIQERVKWSHQLSEKEAQNYTKEEVFSGKLLIQNQDFWSKIPSLKGITNVRDTSYNNYSALKNSLKTNPEAKLISENTPANILEERNIVFANTGTRDLELDAFYPKNKSKKLRPAILIIHGGGWRTGNRSQHIPLAQRLAALGYATFTAEYRLSTEALYPAAVHDLKAAVRWIRANAKKYEIDTNKIASMGFSAGGQLSALLGNTNNLPKFEGSIGNLKKSSKINAIIDIDGILAYIHLESGEGDDRKSISAATYWFGFSKNENPELWHEASALTHAGKNTPPTLFLNSSVDRMHAGRDDYRKKLDTFGIYSEVHTFENSPHSFCLLSPWFEPTVEFIDKFLMKVFK